MTRLAHRQPAAMLYESPISLPEARVGDFAIKHREFKPGLVSVIDMREAFMTGRSPVSVRIDKPMRIHLLVEGEDEDPNVWMSDEPRELRQAGEWIQNVQPRGRVLVGGLGLGIVASWLALRTHVKHVDVVELRQEVVDLVARHQGGYKVTVGDILSFVRDTPEWPWDFCFLDTWRGTGENTWWTEVLPLRRAIANRFGPVPVHCWAESMMAGQIAMAILHGNASAKRRLLPLISLTPTAPDANGREGLEVKIVPPGRHWFYSGLPDEMTAEDTTHFLTRIGLPDWEERWAEAVAKGQQKADG